MIVHRLRNDSAESWALYPHFESRVLAFIQREGVDAEPALFQRELRERFNDMQTPDRHRLVLFLNDDGRDVGHFLAWIDFAWGRPYAHVNQLQFDSCLTTKEVMETMFTVMDQWIDAVNKHIPPSAPKVDTVSWWTWHDPEVFVRYLRRGADVKVSRYVLEYSIKERKARTSRDGAELH